MVDELIGTVGFATVLAFGAYRAIKRGMRAVEDGDAGTVDMRGPRPSGRVADHTQGDHNGVLLSMQQDQQRRELKRRLEASTAVRGPARICGGRVPSPAPVEKGAA